MPLRVAGIQAFARTQEVIVGTPFTLELYHEVDAQCDLAQTVADSHRRLVARLAPHLHFEVLVLQVSAVTRSRGVFAGQSYDVPNQAPSSSLHQSLLITAEHLAWSGLAGPAKGCLSETHLRAKIASDADPADITVHEWLHTLEGLCICGRRMPSPDTSEHHERFHQPSGSAEDGEATWHEWYRFLLRPQSPADAR